MTILSTKNTLSILLLFLLRTTIRPFLVFCARFRSALFAPKGLRIPAQGCREATTLGRRWPLINPNGVASLFRVTARVISGVASHIQVEETEALHVSRIALMVRGYLRSECVKELLSQAQDSSLTHSTLQLRATMSAIRHPCLIMGQCPSNFEGRNTNWSLDNVVLAAQPATGCNPSSAP